MIYLIDRYFYDRSWAGIELLLSPSNNTGWKSQEAIVASPVIIQRLHNIQHNGLRVSICISWQNDNKNVANMARITRSGYFPKLKKKYGNSFCHIHSAAEALTSSCWSWRQKASELQGASRLSQVFSKLCTGWIIKARKALFFPSSNLCKGTSTRDGKSVKNSTGDYFSPKIAHKMRILRHITIRAKTA